MGCCMCEKYKWKKWEDVIATAPDGLEYCLFHAPSEMKKGREDELMDAVRKRLTEPPVKFKRHHPATRMITRILTGTIFPNDIDFIGFDFPAVDFSHSVFEGVVEMSDTTFSRYANFSKTRFMNTACFENSKFLEGVSFSNSSFENLAVFDSSTFDSIVFMDNITFKGDARFRSTTFKKIVDFFKSIFTQNVIFTLSKFLENASFNMATFEKSADFSHCKFCSNTSNHATINRIHSHIDSIIDLSYSQMIGSFHFNKSNINGRIVFDNSRFHSKSHFIQSNIGNASFKFCTFEEQPVFDRTDVRKTEFLGAPVEDLRLMACLWPESNGRRVIYDSRKHNGHGYFPLENIEAIQFEANTPPPATHLEDAYRRLKKVARNEMDELLASDFHYAEKEMQLMSSEEKLKDNSIPSKSKRNYRLQYYTLKIYKFCSGYGEDPVQALKIFIGMLALPVFCLLIPSNLCPDFLFEDLCINIRGLGNKWLHFIPLVRLPESTEAGWLARSLMLAWQATISLQAALLGFALRNKFRR